MSQLDAVPLSISTARVKQLALCMMTLVIPFKILRTSSGTTTVT